MQFVITIMEDDVLSPSLAKQASGCQEKLVRGAKNAYTAVHLLSHAVCAGCMSSCLFLSLSRQWT